MLKYAIAAAVLFASPFAARARQFDIRALGAKCDARTDDAPKIQAALNRLQPGDVLLVSCRAGIGASGLVLSGRRNVTIRGVNGGGFHALAAARLASQGFSPVMMLVQECSRCVVESLSFEMNRVPEAAIGLDRCADTVLRGNTVADLGYPASAAIVATGNRQNTYSANRVLRTGFDDKDGARGMWLGNGSESQEEFRPVISGNTVESAGATGIVVYARGATVTGNTVARAKGAGIKLIVREPVSVVADNTLAGNAFHGIQVESGEGGLRIERNRLEGNAIAGLYVAGGNFSGEVSGNTFSGNREAGVYLYMASGVAIRNNRFDGNGHGVLLEAIQGGSIREVEIAGNAMWDQTYDGIAVRARGGSLAGLRIDGNSFGGRTPAGVRIEDSSNRTVGHISVTANCFDRGLSRSLADQRAAALPAPARSTCVKKEGRPE